MSFADDVYMLIFTHHEYGTDGNGNVGCQPSQLRTPFQRTDGI